ncbi:MAG: glycosyltransferase [Verrucomicrobiota bacterium JB023]|nr:glycosyltransferase [Verrucomicrobiota bacterium JB023]
MERKRVALVSPIAVAPCRSGNALRVKQIAKVLEHQGFEIWFLFLRIPSLQNLAIDEEEMARLFDGRYRSFEVDWCPGGEHVHQIGLVPCLWERLKARVLRFKLPVPEFLTDWRFLDFEMPATLQRSIQKEIEEINPDLIFVEMAICSSFLKNLQTKAVTVIDTHDIYTGRNRRMRETVPDFRWISLTRQQERRALRRADYVLAIQEEECQWMEELLGRDDTTKVVLADILEAEKNFVNESDAQPCAVGYLGAADPTNLRGLRLFFDQVWPLVREKLPNAIFVLAGGASKTFSDDEFPGLRVIGFVDQVVQFYQKVGVSVNPMPGGTGLKLKTIEAVFHGIPVVGTTAAFSGLSSLDGFPYKAASYDETMAEQIISYLQNPGLRAADCEAAFETLKRQEAHSHSRISQICQLECT